MNEFIKDFLLYCFPVILAIPLSLANAISTWQRRKMPGSATFSLLMSNIALWSITTLLLELSNSASTALFWYKLRYLSIATVPVQVLVFGLQFSGWDRKVKTWQKWMLFLIPFISQVFIWIFPDLFIESITFQQNGFLMLIASDTTGPWFPIHFLASVISTIVGISIIIVSGLQSAHVRRWQAFILVGGGIPLIFISMIMATFVNPTFALLTPVGFLFAGLLYYWVLFKMSLFDMQSISRILLVDLMSEGVVVLDSTNRVVDINPSGAVILGKRPWEIIGQQLKNVLPQLFDAFQLSLSSKKEEEVEISGFEKDRSWFVIKASEVTTGAGKPGGSILILTDISTQKSVQEELKQLNINLEDLVCQRTKALEKRARQLEVISQVSSSFRQAESADSLFQILIHEVMQIVPADGAAVFSLQGDHFTLRVQKGALSSSLITGFSIPQKHLSPFLTDLSYPQLISAEQFFKELQALDIPPLSKSGNIVIVPLISNGKWLGFLTIGYLTSQVLTTEDFQVLQAISEIVVIALNRINLNTRMLEMAQERRLKLAILYEISSIANQQQQPELFLDLILNSVLHLRGVFAVLVSLLDADLRLWEVSSVGRETRYVDNLRNQLDHKKLNAKIVKTKKVQRLEEKGAAGHLSIAAMEVIGFPITKQGIVYGTLCVLSEMDTYNSDEDTELLVAITDQIGIAVENAKLKDQAENVLVLAERQRLARELHDSVTQSLYGSVLIAKSALHSFKNGDNQSSEQALTRIVDISEKVLKEMRLLIYDLQPLDLDTFGFQEAIRQRLEYVMKRLDIETYFICPSDLQLSGKLALNLYRIIQEGLNNTIKHSHATRVNVELSSDNGMIRLMIIDNGIGFNVQSNENRNGFGLSGIRERVKELNGSININSQPGTGTKITVECSGQPPV